MIEDQTFRALVERVPGVVYVEDLARGDEPGRTLLYVSPRVSELWGLSPEDWLANPGLWEKRLHPDDRGRVLAEHASAKRSGGPLRLEYRILARDGGIVWISDEAALVRDEAGRPLHWQGVQHDVTGRRRAEEESHLLQTLALEVAEAEDLDSALGVTLRGVCEATGWAVGQVWIPKADGTALECGPAWYADTDGLARFRTVTEALVLEPGVGLPGQAWFNRRPMWTRDITQSNLPRAPIAAEVGLKAGVGIPVLAGSEVVAVLDFFVFEEREEDERLVALVSGVSAQLGSAFRRKRAEEALRESEARNRAVVDTASDAIITMSEDGIVRSFNRAAEDIFGYGPEEVLGQPLKVLMPVRFREPHEAGFSRHLATGEAHVIGKGPIELAGLRKSGEEFPLELSLGETRAGDELMFTGIIRDITERRRAEKALQAGEAGLAEAQRIAHLGSWEMEPLRRGVPIPEHKIRWSDEAYRIFGYARQQFVPTFKSLIEAIHPEDREYVGVAIQGSVALKETSTVLEHRILRPDGEVRFVQARMEMVYEQDGGLVRHFGTILDITERRQAEDALRKRARELVAAQRIASVGNWSFDVQGNRAHWSDEIYRIFGMAQKEPLTYRLFLRRVHPGDRRLIHRASREALEGTVRSGLDYRAVRPDGEVRFVHAEYEVERDASGETTGLVGTLQDVTGMRRAEAKLREQARILDLAPVLVRGLDDKVRVWNAGAEKMYGWTKEEALGKVTHELLHSEHPEPPEEIREKILRRGRWEGEIVHKRKDGTRAVVASLQVLHTDEGGEPAAILEVNNDVTERKAFEEQLKHQAFHDDLTGLPNRRLFVEHLGRALAGLERSEGGAIAVLFMDLDDFKVINDSLGHGAGDQLLVAVAGRLQSRMGEEGTVARFGGDEFALLLEGLQGVGDAVQVAERILVELQTPFTLGGREMFVSPSIGISVGTIASDRAEALLRDADTALYQAKVQGKARHAVFDSGMHEVALERLGLENDLRQALERGEFRVHYQPKVKLDTDLRHFLRASRSQAIVAGRQEAARAPRIVGTEALVRWERPNVGLISPNEFIPVAEETGLIVRIGQWVLKEACLQTSRWNERYPDHPPLTVCVNLSARQFHDPGLCQDVVRILQESGLNPECLCLEITESAVMKDVQVAIATLRELKGLGVELSVDDFGTGHSSLSYLKSFPVDYLKIDRSFIEELKEHAEDKMLVAGIIRLAHTLGMRVVAEGVENAEQLKRLQGLGCDLAQGYYFSRPLPDEALAQFLACVRQT